MMESDNSNNPKKSTSRKKLVDLKAVAALLDDVDGEQGNVQPIRTAKEGHTGYKPNEELIQETTRIKSQRDLILHRIQKMEQSSPKVSRGVYEKVRRDYLLQLESITNLLNEKKNTLNKELKSLYSLREKQTFEVNRHKEILEEAQFRHYLDEFSEEQYKEVEEYESREIQNLQSAVSQIQSYIRIHEELFDPEDLGLPPLQPLKQRTDTPHPPEAREVTRTLVREPTAPPRVPQVASRLVQDHREAPTPPRGPQRPYEEAEELSEVTPPVTGMVAPPPSSSVVKEESSIQNYFEAGEPSDPSVTVEHPARRGFSESQAQRTMDEEMELPESSTEEHGLDELVQPKDEKLLNTGKTLINGRSPPAKEPESIFDVLEDLPLENELAATKPGVSERTDRLQSFTANESVQQYKLVFTETESGHDLHEFPIRDNISIGRSPSNDLVLSAAKVSRQHAAINKYNNQFIIIDLKSSNGVYVNGKKVEEHPLEDGDEVSIGGYKMIFKRY